MNGDETVDEVLAEAELRIQLLAEQARQRVDEVMAEVAERVEDLRAEVRARCGAELNIPWPPAPAPATPMDVQMGRLSELARGARHLLAAVALLRGHVTAGSQVTVGQLAKTTLPPRKTEKILRHLRLSGFFLEDEEVILDG